MIVPLLVLLGQPKYPLVRFEEIVERSLESKDLHLSILKKKLPPLILKAGLGVEDSRSEWIKPVQGAKREFLILLRRSVRNMPLWASYHLGLQRGRLRASILQDLSPQHVDTESAWMLFGSALRRGDRLYVIGNGFNTANWEQPGAYVYRLYQDRWSRLSSIVVSGEMAGETEPRFKNGEPNVVLISLRRYPHTLPAPHAGPLVSWDAELHLQKDRYVKGPIRRRDTAMALMDDIAGCFSKGDRRGFNKLVPRELQERLWSGLVRQDRQSSVSVSRNRESDGDDSMELVLREANLLLEFGKIGGKTQLKSIHWHRGY